MKKMELIAPCHFGLEAVLKREILDLGYEISEVEDGRVTFYGDADAICRANIFLRTAERILLKVGSFRAVTFEELFDKTKELLFVFSDGYLKKVKMEEYESRQKKIVGTKLYNNTLSAVVIADGTLKVKGSKKTYSINTKDIPLHKKGVKGNKLVKLKKDETIESVNME